MGPVTEQSFLCKLCLLFGKSYSSTPVMHKNEYIPRDPTNSSWCIRSKFIKITISCFVFFKLIRKTSKLKFPDLCLFTKLNHFRFSSPTSLSFFFFFFFFVNIHNIVYLQKFISLLFYTNLKRFLFIHVWHDPQHLFHWRLYS